MRNIPVEEWMAINISSRAIIARPERKLLDDGALVAMARAIDDASRSEAGAPLVIFDLSLVAILPSLALGLLVQVAERCRTRQQTLKVVGLQPQLRHVFSITRLDRVLQFADSVEAAIN